jgi:hypothetical protein
MWLNEGIATVAVDRYLDKDTIHAETLELLREYQPKTSPATYRHLSCMQAEAIVYHTTRGYWLTRYIYDKHPDFIKRLLSKRRSSEKIKRLMAEELNIDPQTFWLKIDDVLADYFSGTITN